MSILKRTKDSTSNFRPAVSMQSNTHNESQTVDTTEEDKTVESGKKVVIEGMAEDIVRSKTRVQRKKNPLDRLDRVVTITVSPRIEAQWRYHSNNENRSLASWVRQAVDFYIRKNGLED